MVVVVSILTVKLVSYKNVLVAIPVQGVSRITVLRRKTPV